MFFIRLVSRLPLSALYVLSDFLFWMSYYVVRYRRKLVQKNLRNAFPEKDSKELKNIEREFYRNLCDYAVETLKAVTMTREEFKRRMVFANTEIVERFKASGQPVIAYTSHQFNWEWLLISASISLPIAVDFVYQSVNNRFFDRLMLQTRSRFGAHAILREDVGRQLVLRKGFLRMIALVSDQYPGHGRDKKYITTFLNQETAFFLAINQFAVLLQYPVLFYTARKVKRGYYEARPSIIAVPPYPRESLAVIDGYVRIVEETIREYPAGWLWSHNRWKKRHLQNAAKPASGQYLL